MERNEFKDDLEIDIENLEVEATLQPELYFKYSLMAKEAREKFDLLKMKLSITESELSKKARLKPADFGIRKTTEGAIKDGVTTHPLYRTVFKRMIRAKNEAELMNCAQEAMNQRKRMLELLVQLHGREYFAGPSLPHTPKEFWERIKKKKGEQIHEKMISKIKKRKRTNRG